MTTIACDSHGPEEAFQKEGQEDKPVHILIIRALCVGGKRRVLYGTRQIVG